MNGELPSAYRRSTPSSAHRTGHVRGLQRGGAHRRGDVRRNAASMCGCDRICSRVRMGSRPETSRQPGTSVVGDAAVADILRVWNVDPSAAYAAGLSCRPLAATVADTWSWMLDENIQLADERTNGIGISREREQQILAIVVWNIPPIIRVQSHRIWSSRSALTCTGPDSVRPVDRGCLIESGPCRPDSRRCLTEPGP